MRALITRPQEDAEALVAELHAAGIETFIEPLLNIAALPGAIAKLDKVQAILLTSRNGARALAEITERRDVPIYAVGDATAITARDLGFSHVDSASGDSVALAGLVEDRLNPQDGALLHGSGTAVAGDLAGTLAAKGFTVRCETIYEAQPAAKLSAELQAQLTAGEIDVATFFSPRTTQSFVNLVNSAGIASACRAITAICISPAVARALGSMEFGDVRVASRPDASAMIAAVTEAGKQLETEADQTAAETPEAETVTEPVIETETEPETKNEIPVTPADNRMESDDGEEASHEEPDGESQHARRSDGRGNGRGGRTTIWFLLIALLVIGAGIVTYPKWKSHIPADFLPGGMVVTPAAPGVDVAGMDIRLKQLRAQSTRAIGTVAKDLKTVESQLILTETQLAKMEGQLVAMAKKVLEMEAAVKQTAPPALEMTVLNQRIDSLKKQLEDAKSIGSAGPTVTAMPPGMEDRLDQMEATLKQLAAGARVPASPSAAEKALKAENQALSAAMQSLTARLAAIEAATARNAAAAANAAAGNGSRSSALIIAVGELRDALTRSGSFSVQLELLNSVAAGNMDVTRAIAPLAPFAGNGISTRARLKQQFNSVAAQATRVALVSRDTGWLDQTLGRLSSVVTIRRVGDDVTGDTSQAILARAEARVQADDLAGAIQELAKLTGAPAKAVAQWRDDAQARLTADRSAAAITRIVIHRLAAPDGATPAR